MAPSRTDSFAQMATPAVPVPVITSDQASKIVTLAIEALKHEQNQSDLKSILNECSKQTDPFLQFQMKFSKFIPKVMDILGNQVSSVIDFPVQSSQVMGYIMQIQGLALKDPLLQVEVEKVTKTLSGDFSGLYEEDETAEELELVE